MATTTNLYIGKKFSSYPEFVSYLRAYEREHFVCFSKLDTKRIEKLPAAKPELKYSKVKFACSKGGRYQVHGKGIRNKGTGKTGCQAYIYLSCSHDRRHLEIRQLNETHNHEVSEEAFMRMPQQRRLPPELRLSSKEMLQMKVNKRMLLQKLRSETGKLITMKDLHNLNHAEKLSCSRYDEVIVLSGIEEVTAANAIETGSFQGHVNEPISFDHGYIEDNTTLDEPASQDYDCEETTSNNFASQDAEEGSQMVFMQNKANQAVEDLVQEKKRSNALKERLLEESKKQTQFLEALFRSNELKNQVLEESRKRNKYLEALLKLECINYNQSME